jgi:coenzyme F420-0:L-glutamate ligase / coenzyme F420-1:gamma-L-glutamate ligase
VTATVTGPIEIVPVGGLPEVGAGDRLGVLIADAAELRDGDVVVVAQKVVSKAEGRQRSLGEVRPSDRACDLADRLGKDPRLVELILAETERVIRTERVLIVETTSGLVCANAGIDSSNVAEDDAVLLLPADPDASARRLREEIAAVCGRRTAVIVGDSFGRPWRVGQTEVAIGCAGIDPLDDWRGRADRHGRELAATEIALADQIAAAADLARNKSAGVPAVIVRGLAARVNDSDGPGARALQRARDEDLFR